MVRYVAVFCTSLMLVCCRSEIVKPRSLFDIQRGASRAEVTHSFQGTGKHQFTAIVDGDEVLCASYPVKEWYIEYYFIFHNEELTKILDPRAFDDVDDQVPEWARDVSKPIDPEQRLLAVLEARGLWGESLEQNLERRLPKSRKGALDQFPLVVLLPLAVIQAPSTLAAQRHERAMAKLYDPFKVELETNPDEVAAAVGPPKHLYSFPGSKQIRVFGEQREAQVSRRYVSRRSRFHWVAVEFHDDRVIRVFSNDFFDDRLLLNTEMVDERD